MKKWIRRIAIGVAGLVLLAAIVGAAVETVARRHAVRDFPPHGELVDIGGRRMHLDCRGAGQPVVVLEAGLDTYGSLAWSAVHDSIAATTRVCAYDRAGIMWSDPAGGAFDAGRAAEDLHVALVRAGEMGPWVLVGHSLGGPYATTFAGRFGDDVAGLVFVDASHPEQVARFAEIEGEQPLTARALMGTLTAIGPALTRLGVARLVPGGTAPGRWTPELRAAQEAYASTSVAAMLAELRSIDATFASAARVRSLGDRPFGDRPLVVLTGMAPPSPDERDREGFDAEREERIREAWKALHEDEATWSSRSRHELVPDAGHYIQFDRPDVVVEAVREVVAEVRGRA